MKLNQNQIQLAKRMLYLILVFAFLAGCQAKPEQDILPTPENAEGTGQIDVPSVDLVMTNSMGDEISFVNPATGTVKRVKVGQAPFGLALGPRDRAYVTTAEGVAVVDTKERKRTALIPYRSVIGEPEFGEYRAGGMGIAVSPDGSRVYVGVYLPGKENRLEIVDTNRLEVTGSVPIGDRPFQVLISKDGREVYSVNHDSYSVTVVDTTNLGTKTIEVSPLGRGAFDKLNYGAVGPNGRILLPIQGRVLAILDPESGEYTAEPMSANTHLSGVTLGNDGSKLYIIGAGAAGGADEGASLIEVDLTTLEEKIMPLKRPHENIAVTADGRWAFLTGGYTLGDYGWNGITIINLADGTSMELPIDDRPLAVDIVK